MSDSKLAMSRPSATAWSCAGAVITFTSEEDEVFHAAGFEVAESGAGDAAQIGERGFVAFAGADEEQALSGDAFGIMQEDHFESFAGDFAGFGERADFAFGELVEIGEHAGDAVVAVET